MAVGAKGTALLYGLTAICSLSDQAIKIWVTQGLEQGRLSHDGYAWADPEGELLDPLPGKSQVILYFLTNTGMTPHPSREAIGPSVSDCFSPSEVRTSFCETRS